VSYRDVTDPVLYVGAFASSSQWVGHVDEPRVHAFVLSPAQVNALYVSGRDLIMPDETAEGEVWRADVTPFSNSAAGAMAASNNLTINISELTAPTCVAPPARPDSLLFTLIPTFDWTPSISPFVGYSIYYRLTVGLEPDFLFRFETDSLISPQYTWFDSLEVDQFYYWMVVAWVDLDTAVVSTYSDTVSFRTWRPGDIDGSHEVNVTDLTILVAHLFQGGPLDPIVPGDMNGDCVLNITDLTYLVGYLFQAGPPPGLGCQ